MKKIVPKTMNFGSPNLTKQKKRILGTKQNVTTFLQYFLFLVVVGLSLIFYYFIFYIHSIFTKNLSEKLLLVLKLCI